MPYNRTIMRLLLLTASTTVACASSSLVDIHAPVTSSYEQELTDHVEVDINGDVVVGLGSESVEDDFDILEDDEDSGDVAELACGLWFAPSTIRGSGLGMFAGRDYAKEEYIQPMGDLVIPLVDVKEHGAELNDEEWSFLWDEYTWSAQTLSMQFEGKFDVNVASPGFGSAANSFIPIYNVEEWYVTNDAAGLHRSKDPGVGSFTQFYDRKSTARRAITAGEELYVSYGPHWFYGRPHFGPIPVEDHLELADELFAAYHALQQDESIPQDVLDNAWEIFVRQTVFNESRVIGSFHHDDPDELEFFKEGMTMSELRTAQSQRSMKWLHRRGTCGDHIFGGTSTIAQAGRGAFASRHLPAGTAVAPLPLIHITDRDRLAMYNFGPDNRPSRDAGRRGYQLMLNYCFGHGESSLLLCPYGTMTGYINHNQTLANVRVQWADPDRSNHMPELLNEPLTRLETDATAKLAMELVAVRDIEPGEEIFLDYGDEWEQAWREHVATWAPVAGAADYVPAASFNADKTTRLLTEFEKIEHGWPSNVETICDATMTFEDDPKGRDSYLWPCEILRYHVEDGEYLYTVVMQEEDTDKQEITDHLVEDIPRDDFKFFDKPYTSDIFLRNAFRHDMRIPDSIFPQSWRNLKPRAVDDDDDDDDDDVQPSINMTSWSADDV